jgi:hypothetical protein
MQRLSDWENGLSIRLGGVNGLDALIEVLCDTTKSYAIPIDEATPIDWSDAIRVTTSSNATCPRPFRSPLVPPKLPTQVPTPAPSVNYDAVFFDAAGRKIEVNLQDYPTVQGWVAVGSGTSYERDYVVFNPVEPRAAPSDFVRVLDGPDRVATIWRCVRGSVEGDFCGSTGNATFGVAWALDGGSVVAAIGKGYGGYTTRFQFQCNWSVPDRAVVFDDVGGLSNMLSLTLSVHSRMVCPDYKGPEPATIEGLSCGAVFLMSVLVAFVGYVSGGVVLGWARNEIGFPNEDFWEEVGFSINGALMAAVGACGGKEKVVLGASESAVSIKKR